MRSHIGEGRYDNMSDTSSIGSSASDARPVYFRPFTRESLKSITQRMAEDKIKQAELAAKKAEIEVSNWTNS